MIARWMTLSSSRTFPGQRYEQTWNRLWIELASGIRRFVPVFRRKWRASSGMSSTRSRSARIATDDPQAVISLLERRSRTRNARSALVAATIVRPLTLRAERGPTFAVLEQAEDFHLRGWTE
jgi:hypothetical protein